MTCPHEAWERDTASEADGLCPLCLQATLALTERRLATSEELRTGLVGVIKRLQAALQEAANWCEQERYKLGAIDGYDYRSGEEHGLRRAQIELERLATFES